MENSLEFFITSTGSHNILRHLNKNSKLALDLHEAWSSLFQKIKEENPDLKQNVALILNKLNRNGQYMRELFPLNVLSLFGDLCLVKFIIEHNMFESLSRNCKYGKTFMHHAAHYGHTEIVKYLIGHVRYVFM